MEQKENLHAGHRQRRREQFLRHGLAAFAPHEALELLLFYSIPRSDTNAVAHQLLNRFGSLNAVFSAPAEELLSVEGVGQNTAALLRLVPQIFKLSMIEQDLPGTAVPDAQAAGALLLKYFWCERREVVVELCLDAKGRYLATHRLSEGGFDGSAFNVSDAVRLALSDNAAGVYLAHNHPSGIALPSQDDYHATDVMRAALEPLGIRLLDHIIVAENDFVSLGASGTLG